ncbi:MAG: hypothetical protein HY809_00165 [Nitrospirae bacterium]|nr:hypothetical protein [Nitrospirota bacterium]
MKLLILSVTIFIVMFSSASEAVAGTLLFSNVSKYSERDYNYKYKLPVLVLTIKNNLNRPVTSSELDCDVSFTDIDNKRIISEYGRNLMNDFKVIEQGYTSSPIKIYIMDVEEKILNVIGNNPITFKIKVSVSLRTNNKDDGEAIYETIFAPNEYTYLPQWP